MGHILGTVVFTYLKVSGFLSFGGYIYMNEVERFGAFVVAIFASFCEA